MKRARFALVVFAFLTVAALSGLLARSSSGNQRAAIRVDGRERTYTVHVPISYDSNKAVPLVLALHGRLGAGSGQQ